MKDGPTENSPAKASERAGFYLGGIAVMAKRHRFPIFEIVRNDDRWPGHVKFSNDIPGDYHLGFAKAGNTLSQRRVEDAVETLIAGACAVDLLDGEPPIFDSDAYVQRARAMLKRTDWWYAAADTHLMWLRHRATFVLAQGNVWKSVAYVAQAVMLQPRMSSRELSKAITRKSSGRNDVEHFVMLKRDSVLPERALERLPSSSSRNAPSAPMAADGIVSQMLIDGLRKEASDGKAFNFMSNRLRQVEPALHKFILNEARQAIIQTTVRSVPNADVVEYAIMRSGTLIAEVIDRAHHGLWKDQFAVTTSGKE